MEKISITTIQSHLHWEDKEANLRMFSEKIAGIGGQTHIIVLPEMFSTGFSMDPKALAEPMDGETIAWMRRTAKEKKAILTGSLIIEEEGRFFNRMIWMLPNGDCGTYDKRHRFSLAGEDVHYTSGQKRMIASVGGWRINLQVCYDLRFPVWARQQVYNNPENPQPEYDILINVANWPEKRSLAWKTLLQARAIENQCYVVGVNRVGADGNGIAHSGDSTVIGPTGEILYQKSQEEEVHTVVLEKTELEKIRRAYPFWRDADGFVIV